jgi:hypothetical protein
LLVSIVNRPAEEQLPIISIAAEITSESLGVAASQSGADMKMSAPWTAEFELDEKLNLAASGGEVYRLEPLTLADAERIRDVFGVSRELEPIPANEGGGWRTPWSDGSPNLNVNKLGSWSYSAATASAVTGCAVAEPAPAVKDDPNSASVTPDCPAPGPVKNLPTDSQAVDAVERYAAELELGAGAAVLSYRDDWSVAVEWRADLPGANAGHTSARSTWFHFGAEGELQYANGILGRLRRVGEYPTVDAKTALTHYYPTGALMPTIGCVEPAVEPLVVVPPTDPVPVDAGATASGGYQEPVVGVVDTGPGTSTEPGPTVDCAAIRRTLRVTDVRRTLTELWDADGVLWLVPAYEYTTDDGATWYAVAVEPRYLDRGERTGDEGVTEPVEEPAGGAGSGGSSSPSWGGAESLIGMTENNALAQAGDAGLSARVVERDGEPVVVTKEYQAGRLNLVVVDGIVERVGIE